MNKKELILPPCKANTDSSRLTKRIQKIYTLSLNPFRQDANIKILPPCKPTHKKFMHQKLKPETYSLTLNPFWQGWPISSSIATDKPTEFLDDHTHAQ
jgi:hypothetical protein